MTRTSSLSPLEERAWRGFHRMRAELLGHLARELADDSGLTEADYAVLVNVSEAPGGRMRARDLGIALGWTRSRISHQISRMETRGSVARTPTPDDARGFDIVITAAGRRTIEAAAPRHLERVRHCFADVLTERELESFARVCEKLTAHLEAEHDPSCDGHTGTSI